MTLTISYKGDVHHKTFPFLLGGHHTCQHTVIDSFIKMNAKKKSLYDIMNLLFDEGHHENEIIFGITSYLKKELG